MSCIDPTAFIHPDALVDEGAHIGARTRVWAFAHVLKEAVVGADCNICDHTFIEGKVNIGDRVTVKCGVYLWDGIRVEDEVFIGPNATFCNDVRPRSRCYPPAYPQTLLQCGASIGANATVMPGITVGRWSMVAAGAVVTHDVPDHALVMGIPARIHRWVCACGKNLDFDQAEVAACDCGRSYMHLAPLYIKLKP